MNCYALILAAGDGKRMKTDKQKVMCEVLGEPMLGWVLDSVKNAGIPDENIAVVTGFSADAVNEYLAACGNIKTYIQNERKGSGHAVLQASEMLGNDGSILVLCGDQPFINGTLISAAIKKHISDGSDVTALTAELANPAAYGRIIRDDNGSFIAVAEKDDCTLSQLAVTEVCSGAYIFRTAALAKALPLLTDKNAAGVYHLSEAVSLITGNGGKAGTYAVPDPNTILGADTRAELLNLNIIAKLAVIGKLLDEGVEFVSTDGVIIEKNVRIDKDTKILPGTIIRGDTVVGSGCVLGPNTLIENCRIGNDVILNSVQAYDSRVCDKVKAGPFVQLRPGTILHEGVKIGDFVEIKNSEIGVNTAVAHLTYVGDSDVGKGVNFGCGCVTANYDGINKYRTKIGDYAFIGCNTNLIAPVEIGENATTAAGSTITKAVPPDSLAVERSQTRIIEHWEKNSKRIKKA